jgi:hypothetical protein
MISRDFSLKIALVSGGVPRMATGGTTGQLQRLREAIEGLDPAVHGDAICAARGLLDRLDATFTAAESADRRSGGGLPPNQA